MTLPKITQDNVHLFIPLKIAKVTEMIVQTENRNWEEVMIELYNSKVYADLEKEDTKLWHEGATYIYESFKEEKQNTNS